MSAEHAAEGFYAALLDDDPAELYERAPCGYVSTSPDGTIVKVNETFLKLTGYRRDELVGRRTFSELLTAGGRIYHETHYAPMLRMQGAVKEIAFDIVTADGARLPVLVSSVLDIDDRGEPTVVRAAVFDATDRREYERELLRAKERAEESERRAVALARTLQRTLIPPALPTIPGLHVDAVYRPAGDGREVGGDFYDVFEVDDGEWIVALGDVRGKGVEAAVVTALVRYTIRAAAVHHRLPSRILATVNDVLLHDGGDRYCTVVVAHVFQRGDAWRVTTACGGHPLPLLLLHGSAADAGARFHGDPGTLLGVFEQVTFQDATCELRRGDALVLYTDGVTEARHGNEFFGDEGLVGCVMANAAAADLSAAVAAEAVAFQDGDPRDDIAVVAMRVAGERPAHFGVP